MKLFRKLFSLSLAASLVHASLAPASATMSRASGPASGEPMRLGPITNASFPETMIRGVGAGVLKAPAVTPAADSRQTQASGALDAMVHESSKPAPQDPAETAAATLSDRYDGLDKLAKGAAVEVPALSGSAVSGLSPSSRASSARTDAVRPRRFNSESGKADIRVIGGIAAAAAVVGMIVLVIGLVIHSGNKKNAFWAASKARRDVAAITEARGKRDADALLDIAKRAQARRAKLRQEIASANANHWKKLDNDEGDDMEKATSYEAFDGVAILRGQEGANAVSQKPEQRVGGELPQTWEQRLSAEATAAVTSNSIKGLGLRLKGLKAELDRENQVAADFQSDLKKFQAEVPLAGGELDEQAKAAQKDVAEFQDEISKEQALFDKYVGVARDLVTERLARENPEFRGHKAHQERLSAISGGALASLPQVADTIDGNLQEMAKQRGNQRDSLKLAASLKQKGLELRDVLKKASDDPKTKPADLQKLRADYEELGRKYKKAGKDADAAAAAAQAAAASAKANIEALNRELGSLRRDRALQDEGLADALPASADSSNMDLGNGVTVDLLDPANLSDHASNFTEAQVSDARARFGVVRGVVSTVKTAVATRLQKETDALNAAVAKEMAQELGQ